MLVVSARQWRRALIETMETHVKRMIEAVEVMHKLGTGLVARLQAPGAVQGRMLLLLVAHGLSSSFFPVCR